jgi:hypothetical protein
MPFGSVDFERREPTEFIIWLEPHVLDIASNAATVMVMLITGRI